MYKAAPSVRKSVDDGAVGILRSGAVLQTRCVGGAGQVEGVLCREHVDPGVGRGIVTVGIDEVDG